MMTDFRIDRSQFDKALIEYAAVSKRDRAHIVNRQMLNLAIHGLKLTKEAEASAINKLQEKEWWPKYIAKLLRRKMFMKKVATAFKASSKKGLRALSRFTTRSYTRAQAQTFSKKLIRKRLIAVRFLKFFFGSLGSAVKPVGSGPGISAGKSFKGFILKIKKATIERPTCEIVVQYDYKRRSAKTAKKTESLLNRILNRAYPATAEDMRKYAEGKMKEAAARFNAGRS